MRERLREVTDLPAGHGVVLLRQQADVVAEVEQPLEQLARLVRPSLKGEHEQARELFERLLDLRNDVGLLAEEYDPIGKRQLGNFPQAFTHLALVGTALALAEGRSIREPE